MTSPLTPFSRNPLTSFQILQAAQFAMSKPKTMDEKETPGNVVDIGIVSMEEMPSSSQQLHRKLRGKEVQLFAIGGAIGTCKFTYLSLIVTTSPQILTQIPERKSKMKGRRLIHDNSSLCANGKCSTQRWTCRLTHRLHHLVNSYVSGE